VRFDQDWRSRGALSKPSFNKAVVVSHYGCGCLGGPISGVRIGFAKP
jgi:hypothetical protein